MLNDPLANVMSMIIRAEEKGKSEILIKPVSKVIKEVIKLMHEHGYVGKSEEVIDSRGNYIKLGLNGSVNKCGVIKPRYSIKNIEFEKFESRYLPAKDFGILVVSTPNGIMTHTDAKSKKTGGKLIAYCY
ncbi:MAG TPA: 30S ribosomal protein S8 [Candidatus Nanoarchaeia archaeon]|nr:30S ribosomal protein S8 [Candidatus Nanoarchaeia archaeon]